MLDGVLDYCERHDLAHVPLRGVASRPTRRTPTCRSSTTRSRSARAELAAFGARARGARRPPLHPPEPVHRPQLREPGAVGRARSATSRCRPRCSTRWARPRGRLHPARRRRGRRARGGARALRARLRAAVRRARARGSSSRTTTAPSRSPTRWRSTAAPACGSSGTSSTTTASTPTGIPDREALALALATWPDGVTPKIHWSTPQDGARGAQEEGRPPRRALAGSCRRCAPTPTWSTRSPSSTSCARPPPACDFDVMLEAKAKDLALLRLREQLAARGVTSAA